MNDRPKSDFANMSDRRLALILVPIIVAGILIILAVLIFMMASRIDHTKPCDGHKGAECSAYLGGG